VDDPASKERDWLLEPLGAGEVRVHLDAGEGAVVSDEVRAAVDALLDELLSNEVEGFMWPSCSELRSCSTFMCTLGKCQPLDRFPCLAMTQCKIQVI
jgi:hypothetical protein